MMMRNKKKCCSNCRFFLYDIVLDCGSCRRYPAKSFLFQVKDKDEPQRFTLWPVVGEEGICAEWRPERLKLRWAKFLNKHFGPSLRKFIGDERYFKDMEQVINKLHK